MAILYLGNQVGWLLGLPEILPALSYLSPVDRTKIETFQYYATHNTIYFQVAVYGLDAGK